MPLGPYATFGECVGAQKRKGHTDEEARKICGAMERDLAAGDQTQQQQVLTSQVNGEQNELNNNMSENPEAPKGEVKFNESEIGDITQGLTDAKAFLATVEAPPEVVESVNKAFDAVYSKVEAEAPEAEAAPPFA